MGQLFTLDGLVTLLIGYPLLGMFFTALGGVAAQWMAAPTTPKWQAYIGLIVVGVAGGILGKMA